MVLHSNMCCHQFMHESGGTSCLSKANLQICTQHYVKEHPLFEYSFRTGYIIHQRKRVWGPTKRARVTVLGHSRMNKIEECV